MSRSFLSIAICFPIFFCLNAQADEFVAPLAPAEYAAVFQRGAEHACKHPERATRRHANMLQASCVMADMSGGMGSSAIARNCFGAANRSTFEEFAEVICDHLKI